jgi:hypothetical protein
MFYNIVVFIVYVVIFEKKKNSSILKPLGQFNRNLMVSIRGGSSVGIAHLAPIH